MINLIFFLPNFSYGAGNSTFRLCRNLNKKKYKINIISLGKNSYKSKLKKIGCKVFEINRKRVFTSMFLIVPIVKKIYDYKAIKNIFISAHHHTNIFSIIFLRSLKNLKIIGIERTDISELLIFQNIITYIKNLFIYFLVKVYYRKADLIVSNSKSGKIDIETISNANVTNIPSPSFSSYSKQKSKIKPNFIKIIAVGRLVKEKGYNTIIKALSLLKVKNFSMIILGTGPEETHIKEMIKYHKLEKKVFLKGFKKPKKYFLKSNLFINASLFEGFPNAVVEAINYGLPVICSNCKGGTNEIILNGRGGELFDVNNYIELSKKIIDFNKNPKKYKKKMLLARKNISKFSELSHVSQYERIFKKI